MGMKWHAPVALDRFFGGQLDADTLQANPLGIGLVDEAQFKQQPQWRAPQIEMEDQPIRSVTDRPPPAAFAPLSPFWKDRASLALQVSIDQGTGGQSDAQSDTQSGLMVLDGVHFDMRPGVGRVFLTWRCNFLWPQRVGLPRLEMARMAESA